MSDAGAQAREKRKITKLSLREQIAVQQRLQDLLVCVSSHDDQPRLYEYRDGHSDETVAAEVDFECTSYNVKFVRVELFGELRGTIGDQRDAEIRDLRARVAELERRVRIISTSLGINLDAPVVLGVAAE